MKRFMVNFFAVIILFAATSGVAQASWADHFSAPKGIGPGTLEASGQVIDTLTPELSYDKVGSISYIYVFSADTTPVTLEEHFSDKRTPVMMAKVTSPTLQIPSGILLPGKTYYWYIVSIHLPGTKSEATKVSSKLYFTTAKTAIDG